MNDELKDILKEECEDYFALLEQQLLDEDNEVSITQLQSESHLDTCEECTLFNDAIDVLKDAPPVSDETAQKVVEAHFSRQKNKRIRRFGLIGLAAAAVFAGFIIVTTTGQKPTKSDSISKELVSKPLSLTLVSGSADIDGATAHEKADIFEKQKLKAKNSRVLARVGDLFAMGIESGTLVSFDELSWKRINLNIERGSIAARLQPGTKTTLSVNANAVEITVTGTIFGVEFDQEIVNVHVVRGSVRVTSAKWGEASYEVPAGWSFSSSDRSLRRLINEQKHDMLALLHLADRNKAESVIASEAPPKASETVLTDTKHDDFLENQTSKSKHSRLSATQPGKVAGEIENENPQTLGALIQVAHKCRKQRNWKCAEKAYENVTRLYPTHREAKTVLLSLAEIRLDYLNQPREALETYKLYLSTTPNGPLAQEALYGKIKSLSALGEKGREEKALRVFLEKYPTSVHALNARNRLKELEKNNNPK